MWRKQWNRCILQNRIRTVWNGIYVYEAFMDELSVESEPDKGTVVHMKKIHRPVKMTWDTVALIGRAHQGDKEARDIFVP